MCAYGDMCDLESSRAEDEEDTILVLEICEEMRSLTSGDICGFDFGSFMNRIQASNWTTTDLGATILYLINRDEKVLHTWRF